ncbi:phosphoglycerate mutase family [Fusarium phyllophilum]|uniref:Phosphoglycerate mutase family n=1 Tax=Fusarium phyllophilum TaxID=47803 RepID=A0A8H5ND29_9HYPO|nr:phosphoglycerate mutase family [Fusarium phyllophilum]
MEATQNIPYVEIVLVRHAEAISNVATDNGGIGGQELTISQLQAVSKHLSQKTEPDIKVKIGDFLPDGLTQFGMGQVRDFVQLVTKTPEGRIPNVCYVACSPLSRAIQTAQLLKPALDMVDGGGIICHPGLTEVTGWPQDYEPCTDDKGYRRYILIAGGNTDPGKIIKEELVDTTGCALFDGSSLSQLPGPIPKTPSKESIEKRVQDARQWLQKLAAQALKKHQEAQLPGPARIVVITHGGFQQFLTENRYCNYVTSPDHSGLKFAGTSAQRNLDVNLYRFDEHRLVELPYDEEFSQLFGKHYRCMEREKMTREWPKYEIQEADHLAFIRDSFEETENLDKEVVDSIFSWVGVDHFLTSTAGTQDE